MHIYKEHGYNLSLACKRTKNSSDVPNTYLLHGLSIHLCLHVFGHARINMEYLLLYLCVLSTDKNARIICYKGIKWSLHVKLMEFQTSACFLQKFHIHLMLFLPVISLIEIITLSGPRILMKFILRIR